MQSVPQLRANIDCIMESCVVAGSATSSALRQSAILNNHGLPARLGTAAAAAADSPKLRIAVACTERTARGEVGPQFGGEQSMHSRPLDHALPTAIVMRQHFACGAERDELCGRAAGSGCCDQCANIQTYQAQRRETRQQCADTTHVHVSKTHERFSHEGHVQGPQITSLRSAPVAGGPLLPVNASAPASQQEKRHSCGHLTGLCSPHSDTDSSCLLPERFAATPAMDLSYPHFSKHSEQPHHTGLKTQDSRSEVVASKLKGTHMEGRAAHMASFEVVNSPVKMWSSCLQPLHTSQLPGWAPLM